jgi:hypothetical protein
MSKARNTGNLNNSIQISSTGNITFVNGDTTLMEISSSGAIITTGVISGSSAANAISASYALTSSFASVATSASFASNAATATSASQAQSSNTAISSSFATNANLLDGKDSTEFATTGSNNFVGIQYVSSTSNPNGFGASASMYTDGGLRVTRDAYVSGTIYVNNLSVFGTQSINYITSSQLNISTNIISVNTDTPFIRFGGLSVYDSGSTGLTGSILWDSERDHWVYSNPSGSSYNSGMLISGPRNSGSLGTEQGTLNNVIVKGQGGDHVTSSQMIDDGTTVRIPGNLQVTGSVVLSSALTGTNAAFTGSMNVSGSITTTGAATFLSSVTANSTSGISGTFTSSNFFGSIDLENTGGAATGKWNIQAVSGAQIGGSAGSSFGIYSYGASTYRMFINSSGNVGIGTTTPGTRLEVFSTAPSGDRTIPHNVLTITAEQGNAPYGFFGGAILFKNRSYTSGLVESSRIRSVIYDDGAPNNFGGGLWFETTPTPGGTLTSSLVINYQGRVGIGTTTPLTALTVKSTNGNGYALTRPSNDTVEHWRLSTTETGGDAYTVAYNTFNCDQIFTTYAGGGTGGNIILRTGGTSGTIAERMRITSGGSIQVSYNPGGGDIYFRDTTGGAVMFYIIPATYVGSAPFNNNRFLAANSSNITFETGGAERVRITTDGDMLMTQARSISIDLNSTPFGGSAKYWRLNSNAANGTFRVLQITNGGGMYLDPNNPSGGWIGVSDMRLKNNLGLIEDGALDKIMNLKPRRFTFKTQDENAAPSVGFFAQEIMEYLPETITEIEEEEGEVLTYNANFVIPYLVKSIQEQQAQIEELKALIAAK